MATSFGKRLLKLDHGRSASQAPGKPIKRALIIGINYVGRGPRGNSARLRWGHRDALEWADLLKRRYGYSEDEITLMLDAEGHPEDLKPNKRNIVRQLQRLIDGLKKGSGSRVVLYYSGHSGQLPSNSVNEDDGFDEYLVPTISSGGIYSGDNIIIDNDLRRYLVDRIPEGVYMTAIFDACHSGTMLDLDHYHCNAVYFPWLNRGQRHKSRSKWQDVIRLNALLAQRDSKNTRSIRVTSLTAEQAAGTDDRASPSNANTVISSLRGRRRRRVEGTFAGVESVLGTAKPAATHRRRAFVTRASTIHVPTVNLSNMLMKPIKRSLSFNHRLELAAEKSKEFLYAFMGIRQKSPEPTNPQKCTGWCEAIEDHGAYIVSLSACNDDQFAYDGPAGQSMTQNLIMLLDETPNPPCRNLVERLGHVQHAIMRRVHEKAHEQLAERKAGKHPKFFLDGANFQEPTLGSQRRLTDRDLIIM